MTFCYVRNQWWLDMAFCCWKDNASTVRPICDKCMALNHYTDCLIYKGFPAKNSASIWLDGAETALKYNVLGFFAITWNLLGYNKE